jgi:long-chain acyl-CoA synthetase
VAAEHIEAQYIKNIYVQQVFLYGDSLKAELVAIVVPDTEVLLKWAKVTVLRGMIAHSTFDE